MWTQHETFGKFEVSDDLLHTSTHIYRIIVNEMYTITS